MALADHGASGTYPGFPWRVRDVSRLGARHGYSSALCVNDDENKIRPWVRSHCQLARESSKRVQTGEPNSPTKRSHCFSELRGSTGKPRCGFELSCPAADAE